MTDLEPRQTVIDPRTGVMFPIEEVKDDLLVEIFVALEEREKQYQAWRRQAEDELVRRHGGRREPWMMRSHEIQVESNASREWDSTELQLVVEDLVERGLLHAGDVAGLLLDQEPKVDGRKALDLLNCSEGDALMELRRCFTWKKGRARIKVTPAARIEP